VLSYILLLAFLFTYSDVLQHQLTGSNLNVNISQFLK